ncbi:MAG: PaaI family thioesterase [Pseudomonadota bacterium]
MKDLSGIEQLEAMLAGKFPAPSISRVVPLELKSVAKGDVLFIATANEDLLNPMGGVHGGFAATVLDSSTGCAVHSMLKPGQAYATVNLNVQMIRPVPVGAPLEATGKVLNVSRSMGFAEGWLSDAAGKRYAHATATCAIFDV